MHDFNPPPRFPAEWWTANKDATLFNGPADLLGPGTANERAWVVCTMLGIEEFGNQEGIVGTVFPSAADVILWLRHHVLGHELAWRIANGFNCRGIGKLVDILEHSAERMSAEEFLGRLGPMYCREYHKAEILRIISIHTTLNEFAVIAEQENNAAFRAIATSSAVSRSEGRWRMPQALWDTVHGFIMSRNRPPRSSTSVPAMQCR